MNVNERKTRLTRGYGISQIADYIERTYDDETKARIRDSLPAEVKASLATLQPAAWYPWEYQAALLEGVASTRQDEASVYTELVKCGESIAGEAVNTFLRFLMKILTPTMFANKVGDFWKRDNKGGQITADTSEANVGRIRMCLSGVEGYRHIGLSALGWISFGMKATSKQAEVTQTGWSLENPGPDVINYLVKLA